MRKVTPLLIIGLFLLRSWMAAAAATGLTLWIHPYLPATELNRRFTPLTAYLSHALGCEVSLQVQPSYQVHIDAVGRDRADIAYLGPVSYVRVQKQYGAKPLLAKLEVNGKPYFQGVIICRSDCAFTTLKDLAGKSFAFGDPHSTMGHIVPRGMLINAGISMDLLANHAFLNSHPDVALAVIGGYFDAGAVKEEVFIDFAGKGIKVLARTPPIPEHLFVSRSTLPPERIAKLRTHLLNVKEAPGGDAILRSIKPDATNFLPVADQDYDSLRVIIKYLGHE